MTFTGEPKNSASFQNEPRNSSSFSAPAKHGKDLRMDFLANLTFTDDPFEDGRELKDLTFEDVGDQSYVNETKH